MSRDTYDEKLERILREASAVFAEKGYHRASIRDIARATGISLSGLYYYFGSKEELLFLIQSRSLDTLLNGLLEELEGVDDPEERLRSLIRNHVRFFASSMNEMKVLVHETQSLTGDYREEATVRMREYTGLARDILVELAPERRPADPRVAVFSLFGMMNWIYTWYEPGRDVDVERLADEIVHIFLRGYESERIPAAADDGQRGGEARSPETRP